MSQEATTSSSPNIDRTTQQNLAEPSSFKNSQPAPSALNERQRVAAELIATGKSYSEAARVLEINRATLSVWRKQPAFQARVQERIEELWATTQDRLKSMVTPALEVMAQQMELPNARLKFRAANVVLKLAGVGKTSKS